MIIARNVNKTYKTRVRKGFLKSEKEAVEAVKELNLKIEKGQIIGLLGINGAGKTTTIKMLSTLLEPTSGEITVDGDDIVKDAMRIKKKINMIAGGERMIYWRLTAQENLWYYGQLYGVDKKTLKERIESSLKIVGLEEKKHIPVERFSKGMKQRLQIARGLINDPDYLFMDEPTLGLDAPIAKEIRSYVKALAKEENKGILLTSHYIHEVEELCDYIYILHKGQIIQQGTAEELSQSTFDTQKTVLELGVIDEHIATTIESFTKENNIRIDETNQLNNSIVFESSYDITDKVVALIHAEKLPLVKLYVDEPKLEDTILEISRRVAS